MANKIEKINYYERKKKKYFFPQGVVFEFTPGSVANLAGVLGNEKLPEIKSRL